MEPVKLENVDIKIGLRGHLIVARSVFLQQWKIAKAYLVNTILYIIVTFILALLPILLFNALDADENAISTNFFGGGGIEYINGYVILGVNLWVLILMILWDFSTYLRNEQYTGTLETILMSPAKRYMLLAGRAVFSVIYNLIVIFTSTVLTLLILDRGLLFSLQFLHLLAVIGMVILGCIPMMGLSYTIGALVLKFKEVDSLINSLQWFFGVIMGIFAPFTTLPLVLKIAGFLFPGTWSITDIRAISTGAPPMLTLLGLKNLNLPIFWDTVIVVAFGIFWVLFGYFIFSKAEFRIKREEGLSKY